MWVEKLARFGHATKGVVYGLIGALAVLAAFGTGGGKTTDSNGALQTIAQQPFGQFLLIAIAIGLVGYALWRFIEAIQDTENKGTDAKGIGSRIGSVISGVIYGSLAANAILLLIGSGGGGSGNSEQDWTAKVLQQPFGRWLVGIVGAIIIGYSFYLFYKAYSVKFRQKLNLSELSNNQQKWVVGISRFGIAARGVVFLIIGFFVIQAGYQSDPNEVRGIDGALQSLVQQPFGKFLLGLVAFGLIAYGLYMLVVSQYGRFKTSRYSHTF